MQPARPIVTPHRIARLTRWAQLWLQALAAGFLCLMQFNPAQLRRTLRRASIEIGLLVFLHAMLVVRLPRRKSWKRPEQRPAWVRAIIGSHLRRALRARDPIQHFFAILSVMRDFERHVRRLAKRLALGFTRLRAMPPAREFDVLEYLAPSHAFSAAADTS